MAENDTIPVQSARSEIISAQVEQELTGLLYRSAGFGLFSNVVLALLLAAGIWAYFPHLQVLGWMVTVLVVSAVRIGMYFVFLRRPPSGVQHYRWRYAFFIGLLISGCVWGAAGWLFLASNELLPRCLVAFILMGMNAGAARSLASVRTYFWLYVSLTILPLTLRVLTLDESGNWILAAMCLTYALFLINTATLHNTDLRRLYRLVFENDLLVNTLSEEKTRAEAASQAKSEFLATMSHEIRTPMNAVLGMLQLIDDSPLNHEQKEHVAIAYRSASSLLVLLNDILDLSKIESGKLELESVVFSPTDISNEVISLTLPHTEGHHLAIQTKIDPGLSKAVMGDPTRLRQVLLNLVGNAVKFTQRGSVVLSVVPIMVGESIVCIRFSVRDTGIGMDSKTQSKLFQKFSQGDSSTTRRYGGTGLGLAISQHLVKRMGGVIRVRSKLGEGSEFSFELRFPIAACAEMPRQVEEAALNARGRVLVVENDWANQRVIERMLSNLGLIPVIVDNGSDAVELASKEPWDLVFMDVHMPGLDGKETTQIIRKRLAGKRLPIVALTANVMPKDKQSCFDAGMDDFLGKPFKTADLKDCITKWIQRPTDLG